MFLENQPKDQVEYYKRLLVAVASLSKLFSESSEPYLASRATENLFCKAFMAENLSRFDDSADASKNGIGLGIKTFLDGNGKSLQKIAEFNGDYSDFHNLSIDQKVIKIAQLRNERLEVTKRIFGLDELIYHCITRKKGKIIVYEAPAPLIDLAKIKNIKLERGSIRFSDSSAEYSFNVSKSTLYKRFITENILFQLPIKILTDPFTEIEKLIAEAGLAFAPIKPLPHIFLPLYSLRSEKNGHKEVGERSGLNQWNAKSRLNRKKGTYSPRNVNETYIQIPSWIHKEFPKFFPARDKNFELILPDRRILNAKVCQAGSKALMTNPNSDLGKWILRDVLNLKEGELLTYKKLQTIGLDSIVIYKIDSKHYDIDFTNIGAYEKFEAEYKNIKGQTESEEE